MRKLEAQQISFFYKGNGMGYTQPFLSKFLSLLDDYIKNTDEVVKTDGTEWIFNQLDNIHPYVNDKSENSPEIDKLYLTWAMNIYYLVEKGLLKNDNFNGLLIMY